MEGISDVFNSIRGFNMSVQVAVQSLSQWQEKYPGKEWENQLGSFDMTLYMGCNDMTSAEYFAKKCGKVTISVTNNQFPLAPLFSPIYSTTRPYSQTRSNTQRDLLQPDEFLRLNKFLCIVMFNHYNQIYLARVTPIEDPDYSCAPFVTEDKSEVRGSRTADLDGLAAGEPTVSFQEPQNLLSKNRETGASRTAESAFSEPQRLMPSKKEKRKIDQSHREVSQSVSTSAQDGQTDGDAEEELLDILDGCELECFAPETALVFENAIERLFYADSFRIGNATLPQSRVRAKLRRLDGLILREAESKLRANQERNVKNSTAYTMAVLFNCIAESESDLMIDPYLNTICAAV